MQTCKLTGRTLCLVATLVGAAGGDDGVPAAGVNWIWSPGAPGERSTVHFRKSFRIPSVQTARLWLTCDNEYTVFVNGRRIATETGGSSWSRAEGFEVTRLLQAGENVVAVRATNLDGPAGLALHLDCGAAQVSVATDASWRWSESGGAGWAGNDFDDASWQAAHVIGPLGTAPWGTIALPTEFTRVTPPAEKREPFELRDGDRVVLLGATFVERAQRFGHIEAAITTRFSDHRISIRNLGWDGDTVWAESRGIFDAPVQGYAKMLEHLTRLNPTVVFVAYGANESFRGRGGLQDFRTQLEVLLDDLEGLGALVVLVGPHPHERPGPPLPDATRNNGNLRLYAATVRDVARKRAHPFVDLWNSDAPRYGETGPLTDNGIHLTDLGLSSHRAARAATTQLDAANAVSVRTRRRRAHSGSRSDGVPGTAGRIDRKAAGACGSHRRVHADRTIHRPRRRQPYTAH